MKKIKLNDDPKTEYWTTVAKKLKCSICPPNKGENSKRQSKHGNKTPRHKTK